jgi:putative restriction endonuclease
VAKLSKDALLNQVISAVAAGGWQALIVDATHPFLIRVFRDDQPDLDVRVYIWNCTHGGGAARAKDEFRIQFTGTVPTRHKGEQGVLLGWHAEKGVFVAWDLSRHEGQASSSPSAQVKEAALDGASDRSFAIHVKENGEVVVAFRPEYLVDYILTAGTLHMSGRAQRDLEVLNNLDSLTDADIGVVADSKRRTVIQTIARRYRAHDFRQQVLRAYVERCAVCGMQLGLLDAAHIIPVADPRSTDEVVNGVAMCKLHHFAFDSNLLSFNERYDIEVSTTRVAQLRGERLAGGINKFRAALRPSLLLPPNSRHHPKPRYIRDARIARCWRP